LFLCKDLSNEGKILVGSTPNYEPGIFKELWETGQNVGDKKYRVGNMFFDQSQSKFAVYKGNGEWDTMHVLKDKTYIQKEKEYELPKAVIEKADLSGVLCKGSKIMYRQNHGGIILEQRNVARYNYGINDSTKEIIDTELENYLKKKKERKLSTEELEKIGIGNLSKMGKDVYYRDGFIIVENKKAGERITYLANKEIKDTIETSDVPIDEEKDDINIEATVQVLTPAEMVEVNIQFDDNMEENESKPKEIRTEYLKIDKDKITESKERITVKEGDKVFHFNKPKNSSIENDMKNEGRLTEKQGETLKKLVEKGDKLLPEENPSLDELSDGQIYIIKRILLRNDEYISNKISENEPFQYQSAGKTYKISSMDEIDQQIQKRNQGNQGNQGNQYALEEQDIKDLKNSMQKFEKDDQKSKFEEFTSKLLQAKSNSLKTYGFCLMTEQDIEELKNKKAIFTEGGLENALEKIVEYAQEKQSEAQAQVSVPVSNVKKQGDKIIGTVEIDKETFEKISQKPKVSVSVKDVNHTKEKKQSGLTDLYYNQTELSGSSVQEKPDYVVPGTYTVEKDMTESKQELSDTEVDAIAHQIKSYFDEKTDYSKYPYSSNWLNTMPEKVLKDSIRAWCSKEDATKDVIEKFEKHIQEQIEHASVKSNSEIDFSTQKTTGTIIDESGKCDAHIHDASIKTVNPDRPYKGGTLSIQGENGTTSSEPIPCDNIKIKLEKPTHSIEEINSSTTGIVPKFVHTINARKEPLPLEKVLHTDQQNIGKDKKLTVSNEPVNVEKILDNGIKAMKEAPFGKRLKTASLAEGNITNEVISDDVLDLVDKERAIKIAIKTLKKHNVPVYFNVQPEQDIIDLLDEIKMGKLHYFNGEIAQDNAKKMVENALQNQDALELTDKVMDALNMENKNLSQVANDVEKILMYAVACQYVIPEAEVSFEKPEFSFPLELQ
jgi:hypothetical protein